MNTHNICFHGEIRNISEYSFYIEILKMIFDKKEIF